MESSGIGEGRGAKFRKDEPSYADVARFASLQQDAFSYEAESIACFCGD